MSEEMTTEVSDDLNELDTVPFGGAEVAGRDDVDDAADNDTSHVAGAAPESSGVPDGDESQAKTENADSEDAAPVTENAPEELTIEQKYLKAQDELAAIKLQLAGQAARQQEAESGKAAEVQLEDFLAEGEDITDFVTDNEKFKDLINRVREQDRRYYRNEFSQWQANVMSRLPEMVYDTTQRVSVINEFWRVNPDLKPLSNQLTLEFNRIVSERPELSMTENLYKGFAEAAASVRKANGMPNPQTVVTAAKPAPKSRVVGPAQSRPKPVVAGDDDLDELDNVTI